MSSNNENEPDNTPRQTSSEEHRIQSTSWSNELDLIINCIGYSVGLGNLWRFPFVAFKNGGGAFLIPYLILTCLISFPLYYMELLIGQISNLNPLHAWSFCPFFKGIGITILFCSFVIQVYYNVIMAYALFYLCQTFRAILPWSDCFEWWGATQECYGNKEKVVLCKGLLVSLLENKSEINCTNATESSADQFWRIHVLGLSSGMDDPGTIKWDLALVHLATWIIIGILVLYRHHTTFPKKIKTVYVTALFPFFVLTLYFFYALSLPGSGSGLKKLFVPKWSSLLDATVWSEAAQNSIYSLGLGMGGLIIFGGKNETGFKTFRCASISTLVDAFAGILAATVTFMVVGFLSEKFQLNFNETTLSGPGLVFVTYPDAVLYIPVPQLWAFLFFTMLFLLAVDASVAVTEMLAWGSQMIICPTRAETRLSVVWTVIFLFLAGLTCITNGGPYILNLLDYFGGGHALMGTVMLEAIAFGWGYGVNLAFKDFKSEPHVFMKLCWIIFAPLALIVLFIFTLVQTDLMPLYNVPYPAYANTIGWIIVIIVMCPVPLGMMLSLYQNRKDFSRAFKPDEVWETAVYQTKQ